jgi:hypothetical protein
MPYIATDKDGTIKMFNNVPSCMGTSWNIGNVIIDEDISMKLIGKVPTWDEQYFLV